MVRSGSAFAVVPDRFDRASFHRLAAEVFFLRRGGLLENVGITPVVAAREVGRSSLTAQIAVDALVIHVELPRHVLWIFIRNVGHRLSFVSCNRARVSSASHARRTGLFLFVPLINQPLHYPSHLKEFFLIIYHLFAGVTRNRVFLLEEDGLLGAHLFAQAAVDAADHVDLELFGALLDLRLRGGFLRARL